MFEEHKKIEAKFQEFLEEEFSPTYELEDKMIKAMKVAFEAGTLAGVDLFVEFYNEEDIK